MKKLLLGTCLLLSVFLNAQCTNGSWLVGGDAGFSSAKEDASAAKSLSTISINPNIGYFIIDRLAVGAAINFKNESIDTISGSHFSVGPFVKYFFADLGEQAKLFGQGQFTFGSEKSLGESESVSFTGWDIGAGVAWFFNHNVALEAELVYGSEKPADHNGVAGVATNTFGLKIGFQIELGGHE